MGTLRIILALAVMFRHCGGIYGYTMTSAVTAVEMFYIISGFFMSLVLHEKKDTYASIPIFYMNRFLRIYSTYYVVLLFTVAAYAVIYFNNHGGPFALISNNLPLLTMYDEIWLVFANLFIFGIETTLYMSLGQHGLAFSTSGPQENVWPMALIPPSWSIGLELVFYLMVPFLARLKTNYLVLIVCIGLGARVVMYRLGLSNDPWNYRFFPLEISLFIGGMISYRLYHIIEACIASRTRKILGGSLLAGALISQPVGVILNHFSYSKDISNWSLYAFMIVALPCLFSETRRRKWDNKLGDFSYPLYLIHWPIITLYSWLTSEGPEQFRYSDHAAVFLCGGASLACSWILISLVEKPVDLCRQRLTKRLSSPPCN